MKGVLDSSVLVPVFYGEHVHHLEQAMLFIGSLLERLSNTALNGEEYALQARQRLA